MQSTSKLPGIYIGPRRKLSGWDFNDLSQYYFCEGRFIYSPAIFVNPFYKNAPIYEMVPDSVLWHSLELVYPCTSLEDAQDKYPEFFI